MAPRAHRAVARTVQESKAPDGSLVRQEVRRFDYLGITRGPLVFSTGLVDGFRLDETLRLQAKKSLDRMLEMASGTVGQGDVGARP